MGTNLAAALANMKAPLQKLAKGGVVKGEDDFCCSPELKLAAYEVLNYVGGFGGDDKGERAEKFAKALVAFIHLADAEPHVEGKHMSEDKAEPKKEW